MTRRINPGGWRSIIAPLCLLPFLLGADDRVVVEIPLDAEGGVAMSRIVEVLADATGQDVKPPAFDLTLPARGLPGSLGRSLLRECLGDDVAVEFAGDAVIFRLSPALGREGSRAEWRGRLERLAARTEEAAGRNSEHSIRARPSYRPNDPERPTVCLVHGLNSSSGGFVHMIPLLEEAGYGIVVFDYPFDQGLDESCEAFRADWAAFRERVGERRPWAVVAHSMGALIARSYIEGPGRGAGDVDSLILIAPVNQGSHVARLQPALRLARKFAAVSRGKTTQALAELAREPGRSADDMLPGSAFLKKLNAGPRNEAVPCHILAGDIGLLTVEGRKQVDDQIELAARSAGPLALLGRAVIGDLAPVLDELTDGLGDGAVAVEATKLPGAPEPVVLPANHAELIRAPLLFADPGPVVTMPWILNWLKEDCEGRAVPPEAPGR